MPVIPLRPLLGCHACPIDDATRDSGSRWPGNVRELLNVVEQLVWLSPSGDVETEHLPAAMRNGPALMVPLDERRTLFGMTSRDYRRFMNFLAAHECGVSFREFRGTPPSRETVRATPPLSSDESGMATPSRARPH